MLSPAKYIGGGIYLDTPGSSIWTPRFGPPLPRDISQIPKISTRGQISHPQTMSKNVYQKVGEIHQRGPIYYMSLF